jgi:HK97 family phage major capsid protein
MDNALKAISLDEEISAVHSAFYAQFPSKEVEVAATSSNYWVHTVFDTYAIIHSDDEYYKVTYKKDGDDITFAPITEWEKVEMEWVAAKSNALKTVSMTDDELRVANYIVLFGGRDLEGEFFTSETDFESDYTKTGRLLVDWEHGFAPEGEPQRDNPLGYVDWDTAKADVTGLFVERVLSRRNQYMQYIKELIDAGLIGNSTEAVASAVEKTEDGEIKRWGLKRDTFTVAPMEPRMLSENALQAYKALGLAELEPEAAPEGVKAGDAVKASDVGNETTQETNGGNEMSEEQNTHEVLTVEERIDSAVEKALTKYREKLEAEPAIKSAGVQIIKDELDHRAEDPAVPAYKSWGPFLSDVHKAGSGQGYAVQLIKSQKAITGASSQVPADGGFLVGTDLAGELMRPIYESNILSRVRKFTISGSANSVELHGVNQTSRATGSRWGGIRAYRVNEGDQLTSSKPATRIMRLNLNRVAVLAYATGDVLADSNLLETYIMEGARQELQFFMENDIINGNGSGQPQGIIGCAAEISIPKETGQAADTIVAENIINMWSRKAGSNHVWIIHQSDWPQLYKMSIDVGTGGALVYTPPGGLSGAPYASLMGAPVIEQEQVPAVGDKGDILLVDLSQYFWAEKGGVQGASSMHIRFDYDEMAFRFMVRYDGQPSWNSPLTPYAAGSTTPPTVSPFLNLAERA